MQQFYSVLKNNTLFNKVNPSDFKDVLSCLGAHICHFPKNHVVREPEIMVKEIGIIVKGFVYLTKTDYDGNRTIMSEVTEGHSFGESLAFSESQNSPIYVEAACNTSIVFIPIDKIVNDCDCIYHKQIIKNLIKLLSEKIMVNQIKIDILSQKTIREKLLLYFEYESKAAGSKAIKIHFSRDELADYLCQNASAVSRELGKMRDEGILTFKKNKFILKK